ncbi:radical SAM protein [bacterium]|nr:radical SAM protein [bacterium]
MNPIRNAIRPRIQVYKKYSFGAPGFKPLQAYWNWIRANYEMATQASIIKARPLKLNIDVTNGCQLSCPMCPTGLKQQDRPIGNLSQDLFKSLLDEIGDFVFFIDFFNWGEPLINKKLDEYIKIANQKKIWTTISTNLSLPLSDQRIQDIIESGLSEMIISADGASPETYSTYRQGGDFELVMQNMQRFVRMKKSLGRKNPYIIWRFLVFGFNENEIQKASDLANQYEVDGIVFAPPYIDYERFPDWIPKDQKFQMKSLQDHLEFTKATTSSAPTSNEKSPPEKHRSRCDWHYISAAMNPDGSIAPCCALFGKNNDFASYTGKDGGSYMAGVNSEKYQLIRNRFAGHIDHAVDLVCENCPTPEIMNVGKSVNKLISVLTAVQFMEGIKRIVLSPLRLFQTSNHH